MSVLRFVPAASSAFALTLAPGLGASDAGATPRTTHDCGRAEFISQLEVVFGRTKTLAAADALRAKIGASGFVNANVIPECGGYKVTVRGEENFDIAVDLQTEARRANFSATIECIKGKDDASELEVVLGHRRDRATAADLVTLTAALGFTNVVLESDPCGGYEIVVKGFADQTQADDFVAEAKGAGLDAAIETS